MKIYILLIALTSILLSLVAHAEVTMLGSLPVDIEIVRYDKPLLIKENDLVDEKIIPFWWDAYNALANYREYENYEDWIQYFTPEYIDRFQISEDNFIIYKNKPVTQIEIEVSRISSALYGVKFKFIEREVFILKLLDSKIENFSGELSDYDDFSATEIYEKVDGVWKNQTPEAIGQFYSSFPFRSIEATTKLMNAPFVIIDARGKFAPASSNPDE